MIHLKNVNTIYACNVIQVEGSHPSNWIRLHECNIFTSFKCTATILHQEVKNCHYLLSSHSLKTEPDQLVCIAIRFQNGLNYLLCYYLVSKLGISLWYGSVLCFPLPLLSSPTQRMSPSRIYYPVLGWYNVGGILVEMVIELLSLFCCSFYVYKREQA